MRKALPFLGLIAALTVLFALTAGNRREILAAQTQARSLAGQRDSLVAVVQAREAERAGLAEQAEAFETEAMQLRDSVGVLEQNRSAAQLSVREIQTIGALQERLRTAFPELGPSCPPGPPGPLGPPCPAGPAWGLTTIPIDNRDTVGIQYLLVPAWFAETFIINRLNAKSWLAQRDRLLQLDSFQLAVTRLQDSVTTLVALNAEAYRSGYQAAYAGYQDVSKKYVAELKKPRIRLLPSLGVLAVAGAACFVGQAIQ